MGFSNDFEITPININFKGIEVKQDTIVTYGEFGSMLISYDNAQNWQQIRVFEKGSIVKMFLDSSKMLAFSNYGQINSSYDNGKSWVKIANLYDSVLAVIRYPNGYFLRMKNRLITISNDFQINNEFQLYSRKLVTNEIGYKDTCLQIGYLYSITNFKQHLIAEIDSGKYIRFDYNLIPVDTLSIGDLGLCTSCFGTYQIYSDSDYFYCKVDSIIFRTSDFKTVEEFHNCESTNHFLLYKLIENKIYYIKFSRLDLPPNFDHLNPNYPSDYWLNPYNFYFYEVINIDTAKEISEFHYKEVTFNVRPKEFFIDDNKIILAGDSKFIAIINRIEDTQSIISDFSGGKVHSMPDKINDSTYLFYSGYFNGRYTNTIYITDNYGLTFKPTVDTLLSPNYKKYYNMMFKYFDESEKTLYMGGPYLDSINRIGGVQISKDFGKSFQFKSMPNFQFNTSLSSKPTKIYPGLQKYNDNFITVYHVYLPPGILKAYFCTYDKNFNLISKSFIYNYVVDYVYSTDTNSFLIHANNWSYDKGSSGTNKFLYTTDQGKFWGGFPDSLNSEIHFKEIRFKDKIYFIIFDYNSIDSVIKIVVVDVVNKTMNTIYKYKIKELGYEKLYHNGICSDKNYIYIAIQDTLFYTNDLYDFSKWKKYIFPNGGNVIRTFSKYGDTFFARYVDSLHDDNIYWLKISSLDTTSVEENEIEELNYLYAFPPFPIPAKNYIKTLIYWDLSLDIDKDEIAVYNIYGEQICGRERIRIDKKNSYSGWLVWDCSDVESGIYFIKINHGTRTLYLKVLVDR